MVGNVAGICVKDVLHNLYEKFSESHDLKPTKSHKMFRSAVLRPRGKTFRNKEPIPDQRIYKDRTLEVGIVVDKMLFLKMKVCKFGL